MGVCFREVLDRETVRATIQNMDLSEANGTQKRPPDTIAAGHITHFTGEGTKRRVRGFPRHPRHRADRPHGAVSCSQT